MKRTILAACPVALVLCAWASSAHAALTANIVCYAWANEPTTGFYNPDTTYSFNKTGGPITIQRRGPGSYQVICTKVPGGPRGGHVQVSAYGDSTTVCNTTGWGHTPLSAGVQCRSLLTGAPTDSFFDFLFVR